MLRQSKDIVITHEIEVSGGYVTSKRFAGCCALLLSARVLYAQNASVSEDAKKEEIYVIRSCVPRVSLRPITVPNPEPVLLRPYSRIRMFFIQ